MNNIMYSFLVLLGCLNSIGKGDTFGTGILIEYEDKILIVSCKHVYNEIKNKGKIFAIPEPRQTLTPKNGYNPIYLGKPYSHPDDNHNTYDVVVFKLRNANKQNLLTRGIIPLLISKNTKFASEYKQELFACTYPIDYAKDYLANEKEDYLPPKKVKGYLKDVSIESLVQIGFIGNLIEGYFIETNSENILGKGSSGGLVFTTTESNPIVPLGLIVGHADIENKNKETTQGIVFIKIDRIIETIKNIE